MTNKLRKIKKQIRRTVVYTEYKDGVRSLKANLPDEIERWIAKDYVHDLFLKEKQNE